VALRLSWVPPLTTGVAGAWSGTGHGHQAGQEQ